MNGHVIENYIAVDYWQRSERLVYFLSHLHSDHRRGLGRNWKYPLYTSEVNAKLLVKRFGVASDLVRVLEHDVCHSIPHPGGQPFSVTLIDANHCPGAVCFFFQGDFGNMFYTGDFRFNNDMLSLPHLSSIIEDHELHVLYLDNTFLSPICSFPSRQVALQRAISIITDHPDHLVKLLFSGSLGKENVLVNLATHFNEKVCVGQERMEMLTLLEYPTDFFTLNADEARFHVAPISRLSSKIVSSWQKKHPTIVLIMSALFHGWSGAPFSKMDGVFVIPYSDHSSYQELQKFVTLAHPRTVRPIVKKFSQTGFLSNAPFLMERASMELLSNFLCNCSNVTIKRAKNRKSLQVQNSNDLVRESIGIVNNVFSATDKICVSNGATTQRGRRHSSVTRRMKGKVRRKKTSVSKGVMFLDQVEAELPTPKSDREVDVNKQSDHTKEMEEMEESLSVVDDGTADGPSNKIVVRSRKGKVGTGWSKKRNCEKRNSPHKTKHDQAPIHPRPRNKVFNDKKSETDPSNEESPIKHIENLKSNENVPANETLMVNNARLSNKNETPCPDGKVSSIVDQQQIQIQTRSSSLQFTSTTANKSHEQSGCSGAYETERKENWQGMGTRVHFLRKRTGKHSEYTAASLKRKRKQTSSRGKDLRKLFANSVKLQRAMNTSMVKSTLLQGSDSRNEMANTRKVSQYCELQSAIDLSEAASSLAVAECNDPRTKEQYPSATDMNEIVSTTNANECREPGRENQPASQTEIMDTGRALEVAEGSEPPSPENMNDTTRTPEVAECNDPPSNDCESPGKDSNKNLVDEFSISNENFEAFDVSCYDLSTENSFSHRESFFSALSKDKMSFTGNDSFLQNSFSTNDSDQDVEVQVAFDITNETNQSVRNENYVVGLNNDRQKCLQEDKWCDSQEGFIVYQTADKPSESGHELESTSRDLNHVGYEGARLRTGGEQHGFRLELESLSKDPNYSRNDCQEGARLKSADGHPESKHQTESAPKTFNQKEYDNEEKSRPQTADEQPESSPSRDHNLYISGTNQYGCPDDDINAERDKEPSLSSNAKIGDDTLLANVLPSNSSSIESLNAIPSPSNVNSSTTLSPSLVSNGCTLTKSETGPLTCTMTPKALVPSPSKGEEATSPASSRFSHLVSPGKSIPEIETSLIHIPSSASSLSRENYANGSTPRSSSQISLYANSSEKSKQAHNHSSSVSVRPVNLPLPHSDQSSRSDQEDYPHSLMLLRDPPDVRSTKETDVNPDPNEAFQNKILNFYDGSSKREHDSHSSMSRPHGQDLQHPQQTSVFAPGSAVATALTPSSAQNLQDAPTQSERIVRAVQDSVGFFRTGCVHSMGTSPLQGPDEARAGQKRTSLGVSRKDSEVENFQSGKELYATKVNVVSWKSIRDIPVCSCDKGMNQCHGKAKKAQENFNKLIAVKRRSKKPRLS